MTADELLDYGLGKLVYKKRIDDQDMPIGVFTAHGEIIGKFLNDQYANTACWQHDLILVTLH